MILPSWKLYVFEALSRCDQPVCKHNIGAVHNKHANILAVTRQTPLKYCLLKEPLLLKM